MFEKPSPEPAGPPFDPLAAYKALIATTTKTNATAVTNSTATKTRDPQPPAAPPNSTAAKTNGPSATKIHDSTTTKTHDLPLPASPPGKQEKPKRDRFTATETEPPDIPTY